MKLNVQKIREALQEQDRPVAWLAREIGISPQTLHNQLKKGIVIEAAQIAKALKISHKDIIIWEA